MENIYKQIDGIFKNGLINSGISIIVVNYCNINYK